MTRKKTQKNGFDHRGVIVPVVTPVDENERIDEAAFRKQINRLAAAKVDGIFVGGSAGTGPMFPDEEWRRMMEIAFDAVASGCGLLGGVIETSTRRAVEKIKFLERVGYGTFVMTPTFYVKLTRGEEFLTHFGECRQATDMDMVVYNIPQCVGSSIPIPVIERALKSDWMVACKESSEDRGYFQHLLDLKGDFDFQVLQGSEPDVEWALERGADGMVPVCANFEPATYVNAWRAHLNGETKALSEFQRRFVSLRETLLRGDKNWISGILAAVAGKGIGEGVPLKPLRPLKDDVRETMDGAIRRLEQEMRCGRHAKYSILN